MSHPLVVNIRSADCDVNIMRPGPWGNPFKIGDRHPILPRRMTRAEAIQWFKAGLYDEPFCYVYARQHTRQFRWMRENIHVLRGSTLGCCCAPHPCHGDILAEMANGD